KVHPIWRDEDVLDTWFSSALWPFSTLGWPDDTRELKFYYPTSLLVTGFDIIFFWVARMMMFGLKCVPRATPAESVPFRDVYITPLVRDQYGKKMTKSRGNVVDPLEIMERYGTDAVRFTLAQMAIQGRDLILSDDRLAASRAFANKIWNAARFVLMNLDGAPQPLPIIDRAQLSLADRWILSRLDEAIRGVTNAIDAYEFNNAALVVYQFIWHEFCDWYIELSKEPLKAGGERQAAARYVLVTVFDKMLRILHPFMPFISEEIWQALKPYFPEGADSEHLAVARFPVASDTPYLTGAETVAMQHCVEATQAINSLRALAGCHPGQRVTGVFRISKSHESAFETWKSYARMLGKLDGIMRYPIDGPRPSRPIFAPLEWGEIGIEPPDNFDSTKTRLSLKKKLDEVSGHLDRHRSRYENPGFRAKADAETVADVAERIEELQSQQRTLETQISQLS
ncbi:MAG TPA: class I tRNA ligase family protein, partial [Candidatus Binataceae bacterium]|nr:class I tRNA ligase family protein [Candidatus Binataceae bacterium]